MGILEETKVTQVINRLENTRSLLEEVKNTDQRFKEDFTKINKSLEGFTKQLKEIQRQLNVENLGESKLQPNK